MKKEIIILAGGSSGIGSALEYSLLQKNNNVINLDLKKPKDQLNRARWERVNLCEYEEVKDICNSLEKDNYSVKGLVVTAGIGYNTLLKEMGPHDFMKQISSNLTIAFNLVHSFNDILCEGASIVFVSSLTAYGGVGVNCAYSAAKAGLVGLSKALAIEMANRKIRINTVVPGFVKTPMLSRFTTAIERKMLERYIPHGLAEPKDIANAIEYFLAEESCYITGQTLVVDGGMSLTYSPAIR